ncbi:MAG: hypothetical protein QOJ79_1004, partial [Actinomycetota bacterium]|nr:hypothetical protein [Actinomycetota bacterium]
VQSACVNFAPTTPTYAVTAVTGVIYKVAGTATTGGNGVAGTTMTMTAVADTANGYVLAAGATTSFPMVFDTAPTCTTSVTARAPTLVQSTCVGNTASTPTYTVTAVTGVIYKVGAATKTGTNDGVAGTTMTLTAVADTANGYVLAAASPTSFPMVFAAAPECADPTATVTKTNDANGDGIFSTDEESPAVTRPVTFKLHVRNTSPYAISVGQSISDVVWVGAQPTQETAPTSYTCLPAIANLAPNATADCTFTVDSYSPADGAIKSDQATVTLTKYVAPLVAINRLRVAAFVGAAPFTATSNVSTVKTNVPPTRVAAVAPTVTQSQCANGVATTPSYTVPVTPGVVYSPAVGGAGVPGTTVTVTATAVAGFVLSNPGASPFSVVFAAAPSCGGNPPPPIILPSPSPSPSPSASPAPDNNLGVSKTGPGSAHPGDELVYTIDVTNAKGTPATAFTVTDVLPVGLAYSSASGTAFTCAIAGQTIACVYSGTLTVGQHASIIVRALLDAAYTGKTVANTALVDPGRADTDAADNSSTATTDVVPVPLTGGGGGAAEEPTPAPSAAPTGGGGGAVGLPFTGANSLQVLRLAVLLLVVGLFLMLVTRRRRGATE